VDSVGEAAVAVPIDGDAGSTSLRVPIQNIYNLLVYAWDVLDEAEVVDAKAAGHTNLTDLFAVVLKNGVDRIIRRGIDRDYVSAREDLAGVRGRIQVTESIKRLSMRQARVYCEFDELSYDVVHNQIVKATLRALARSERILDTTRNGVIWTYRRLPEIRDIRINDRTFRSVQLHRNNRHYRFLLELCRFISRNLMVDERAGESAFRDFARGNKMPTLFEKFLRNFYRQHAPKGWNTKGKRRFKWQKTSASAADLEVLPGMELDVSLEGTSRCLVFDAKFYANALRADRFGGGPRLHEANIYQMFAYMSNLAVIRPGKKISGALIYPKVKEPLNLRYEMHGHTLRVVTIDLGQEWEMIKEDLLSVLESFDSDTTGLTVPPVVA
jgi:5-methylcytosine-specific restriction enzyme subunit McrC